MLARIGPVKPFLLKVLIAQSEHAVAPKMDRPPERRMRRVGCSVGGEPGRAKGAHRPVSAVSAEIAGGTLPTRPG
jgi:hypothetical protein